MPRKLVAILISILAIGFAFAAMAAVRWPSIVMAINLASGGAPSATLDGIDWRELGIIYGGPYFLAALCLYASAAMVSARRPGGVKWYLLGCAAGFPCAFLVDFEPDWWRDPSASEGAVAGLAVVAGLLAVAVWDLRLRRHKRQPAPLSASVATPPEPQVQPQPAPKPPRPRPVAPGTPFPNAVARNRAAFIAQGRRSLQPPRR